MRPITFPDGTTVPNSELPWAMVCTALGGQKSVVWSVLPVHAWTKANTPDHLGCHRVLYHYDLIELKQVQVVQAGKRAVMPGEYR